MDRIDKAEKLIDNLFTATGKLNDGQAGQIFALLLLDMAESLRKIAIGTSNINPEK